jgi:hypothetical protein
VSEAANAIVVFQNDIRRLQKNVRRLQVMSGVLAGMLVVGLTVSFASGSQEPSVLKARGLVLVDETGRERIWLGAPAPGSATLGRKDIGPQIVILDEKGKARLVLGENDGFLRDGKLIERERGFALLIHDAKGDERGGFGCFDSGKAVIALDRKAPDSDGIGMMVDDSLDFAGLVVNHKMKKGAYVQGMAFGVQNAGCFLNMDDPSGNRRMSLQLADGKDAELILFDAAGKVSRDALAVK